MGPYTHALIVAQHEAGATVFARVLATLALLLAVGLVTSALGRLASPPGEPSMSRCRTAPIQQVAGSQKSGFGTLCVGPTGIRAALQAEGFRPQFSYTLQLVYVDASAVVSGAAYATPPERVRIIDTTHADALGTIGIDQELVGVFPKEASVAHLVLLELQRRAEGSQTWWPLNVDSRHRLDSLPDDDQTEAVATASVQV